MNEGILEVKSTKHRDLTAALIALHLSHKTIYILNSVDQKLWKIFFPLRFRPAGFQVCVL